jgi:hypothetical protein
MIPKEGKIVHRALEIDCITYATEIADALRTELGPAHRATKTLMRWSGATDRCVKNWLSGSCGPSGRHLLMLARHSDAVFACMLRMSGRDGVLVCSQLRPLREALSTAIEAILSAERHGR